MMARFVAFSSISSPALAPIRSIENTLCMVFRFYRDITGNRNSIAKRHDNGSFPF
jgi:hypothetical protein